MVPLKMRIVMLVIWEMSMLVKMVYAPIFMFMRYIYQPKYLVDDVTTMLIMKVSIKLYD